MSLSGSVLPVPSKLTLSGSEPSVTSVASTAVGAPPELVPYDAAAKAVLSSCFRVALRLGHDFVGTEDLLLALVEHEGADGPLRSTGLTPEATHAALLAKLAEPSHP